MEEEFSTWVWVCRKIGGKVYVGAIIEIPLPPERIIESSELVLKTIRKTGLEVIGHRIEKTGAEIQFKVPNDKEAEFKQKLTDITKKHRREG